MTSATLYNNEIHKEHPKSEYRGLALSRAYFADSGGARASVSCGPYIWFTSRTVNEVERNSASLYLAACSDVFQHGVGIDNGRKPRGMLVHKADCDRSTL